MSKYFSRFEREAFMVMICAFDRLSAWAKDSKCNLTEDDRKKMEMAVNNVEEIFKGLADRLDEDYLRKIASDIKNIQIILEPKRVSDRVDESRIKTEDLETIAEYALWRCQGENALEECGNYKECNLYKSLMEAGIPVANLDTNGCPYKL